MELIFATAVALFVGISSSYLFLRTRIAISAERIANLERRLAESQSESQELAATLAEKNAALLAISSELSASRAELAAERQAAMEKLALVQQSEQRLSESFDLLAAKALKENASEFLKLA